ARDRWMQAPGVAVKAVWQRALERLLDVVQPSERARRLRLTAQLDRTAQRRERPPLARWLGRSVGVAIAIARGAAGLQPLHLDDSKTPSSSLSTSPAIVCAVSVPIACNAARISCRLRSCENSCTSESGSPP